ncbi:hypothetical protein GCM10018772_08800 [Streptomyces fumanus]|uniref:Uncharacterized protein n=1 Tax=Streptomyces fumanus TaxID=67302 RepID=A0A919A691_9ACTN|nr:hypothetical protein GCM10018772_08800 [Streptomyces fumanus]
MSSPVRALLLDEDMLVGTGGGRGTDGLPAGSERVAPVTFRRAPTGGPGDMPHRGFGGYYPE